MIILAVQLFIGLIAVAVLSAVVAAGFWVLLAALVVYAIVGYRRQEAIRKYSRDLDAGLVQPTKVERCADCQDHLMPCEACVQRFHAAHPA